MEIFSHIWFATVCTILALMPGPLRGRPRIFTSRSGYRQSRDKANSLSNLHPNMKPDHPLQPVVDRIVPIRFERGLQALSPAERNVFLVWCYPAAVNDGGHVDGA
jgi:hypothetical protein